MVSCLDMDLVVAYCCVKTFYYLPYRCHGFYDLGSANSRGA